MLGLVRPLLYTMAAELTESEVLPVSTAEREDGNHNPTSSYDVNQDPLRRPMARGTTDEPPPVPGARGAFSHSPLSLI
jgi:hypothetical protein